ncbi:hypothetical protein B0H66DRAFT_602193 [Apodospora peruviana]|uniref:Tyrosinase copper-binding domain-containing protein n=1 Tax=Apodospora peruviana TaxID=516989 RepID=A0AAE0ID25_9PEZI|nr:hypothetical protein B0H66DRAFT_602193 [Apodospora peruviana]
MAPVMNAEPDHRGSHGEESLTTVQRASYINATLCLMTTPAKLKIPGAKTRWDELHYAHIAQSAYIHFVGAFLPWHRYFLLAHETVLRKDCGYRGPIPYWNETSDVQNLRDSFLLDPDTGFGGNGVSGKELCIADGPFADIRLHLKANLSSDNYCISRNMSACLFSGALTENIETCLTTPNFEAARNCIEAKPHIAGHWGVGGTMSDTLLSPGDPLFYLHHVWLDKIWWEWQSRNLSVRLTEMSGPNIPIPPPPTNSSTGGGGPPPGKATFKFGNETCSPAGGGPGQGHGIGEPLNRALTDFFGDGGNVTTLDHTLWSAGILPNATIRDVMDLEGPFVCAEYHV